MRRYDHRGGAHTAELQTAMTANTPSTITISDDTGWPDAAVGSFFIVIDRGQPNEEKLLIAARTGSLLTIEERGADNTSGRDHAPGAVVEHVFSAVEADQLNDHVTSSTNVHGLAGGEAVLGTNDMTAHAATTSGVHGAPADDPLVYRSQLDSEIAGVYEIGEVRMFATITVPAKWIPCDGGEWPQADYPDLYAAIGDTFGAASAGNFRVPDLMGRVPRGDYDPGPGSGADSVSIGSANMPSHTHSAPSHTHSAPSHTHSINHDHPSATTGTQSASHYHSINPEIRVRVNAAGLGSNNRLAVAGGTSGTEDASQIYSNANNSGNQSSSHSHSFNVPSYSGTSGSAGGTTGSAGGTTGSAGSGTPLNVTPAHTLLLFAIYAGVEPAGVEVVL